MRVLHHTTTTADFSLEDLSELTDGMLAGQTPEWHRAVAHSCWPALTAAMAADTDLGAAASTPGTSRDAVFISAGRLPTMRQQVCTSADLQPRGIFICHLMKSLSAIKDPAELNLTALVWPAVAVTSRHASSADAVIRTMSECSGAHQQKQ